MIDHQNEIRFVPLKIHHGISPASDVRGVAQLLRLIKLEGPFDIVHGHSAKGGAIARIAGRLSGVPTVYTPNGLIMSYPHISRAKAGVYALLERILGYWATSSFVTVSEGERNLILKLKLAPSERITLIENCVNVEDFEYFSEEPTYKDISEKPLTFGSLTRFSAEKAPDHLIEAFIRLSGELPQTPLRLVIAGDGELFGKAKNQVKVSGLGEKISLLGWRVDIKNVLREFDVFVLSSFSEAFSYTILEAMAAKLPIVSTNVSGTKETVSQVPGNILVPPGNPATLAEGMKRLATVADSGSIRQVLQRIGQANHDYVRAHFRQSENTRRNLQIYKKLHYKGKESLC
jgi:glycosyltransferase involved in cell wall biosynthesis